MLEKPGDYTLPAIELAWWNVRDSKIERARADSIVLHGRWSSRRLMKRIKLARRQLLKASAPPAANSTLPGISIR